MCRRIAKTRHEFGGRFDELTIDLTGKFAVTVLREVLPKRPDHQRGAVFLKRNLRAFSFDDPRMPGGSHRAIRPVLMHESRTIFRQNAGAKLEKGSGQLAKAHPVQGIGDQCPVSRPKIGIMRPGRLHDITVIGCEDGSALIYLCSDNQKAAGKQLGDARREAL